MLSIKMHSNCQGDKAEYKLMLDFINYHIFKVNYNYTSFSPEICYSFTIISDKSHR